MRDTHTPAGYPVGRVAELAGVTVRTLHHYDGIGLLVPSERTAAGYRRYTDDDLARLQQILFYRELGFPLDRIAAVLDDPRVAPTEHLRRQHELLTGRIARLRRMAAAVEAAMEARHMGINLTPEERFEVFGDFRPEDHDAEVTERWGDTDAYKESQRRAARYTKADWQAIKAEGEMITQGLAAALRDGEPATGERAMDLAERHRRQISERFHDCDHRMHRGLGDLYVADPRFTATYETVAPGLARYVRDAIHANADRAEAR